MKTLEQIKEEYAKSHAFNDWKSMYSYLGLLQRQSAMDEVAQRYADEYAKEALRLASENAKLTKVLNVINYNTIDKDSILSESNLPSHVSSKDLDDDIKEIIDNNFDELL